MNNKIMSLFKANATKDYSKPTHVKNVYSGRKTTRKLKIKKSEDSIIKNARNLFKLKKETEPIKDMIVRGCKSFLNKRKITNQ